MNKTAAGIIVASCIVIAIVVVVVVIPRLTPAEEPTYELTVSSTEGGSVTAPGEATFTYDEGEVVDLVAMAAAGYEFVAWSGNVATVEDVDSASPTITMNGDYTITAEFKAEETPAVEYTLTISSIGGGEVTVPGEGMFIYEAGTVVDLVAMAADGYEFVAWSGDVATVADIDAASTTITMSGDYTITASFEDEETPVVEYIMVATWYDLHGVRDNLSGNYRLANYLHSGTAGYAELAGTGADGGRGWQPIGNHEEQFTGTFDGQGYFISGVFINRPDEVYVGLFGYVGVGGVVTDVDLSHMGVSGHEAVGGLVGSNEGMVLDCGATGSVTGSQYVGGLTGINIGSVGRSYSNGSATGTGNLYVGGLVGWNDGTVTNSCSLSSVTGYNVIGGLVGLNSGSVDESYSVGRVMGIGQYLNGAPVGGLVGQNEGTVSNSFWDVENSEMEESHGGTGKTTVELTDIMTFTDTATEGLDSPWDITTVQGFDERDTAFVWNIVDGVAWPFQSWRPYLI